MPTNAPKSQKTKTVLAISILIIEKKEELE